MLESVPRFLVLSESMLLLSGFDCIFFLFSVSRLRHIYIPNQSGNDLTLFSLKLYITSHKCAL